MEFITNLFTQLHIAEMDRVLRPDGHVLVVTPAADHLWTLRARLFEQVRPHVPEKFFAPLSTCFEPVAQEELRIPLSLHPLAVQQLLQMTPYAWKAQPARRQAVVRLAALETEAAFSLMLFRRRARPPPRSDARLAG